MGRKGDIIPDKRRNLAYQVTDVRGTTVVIERVLPPSNVLSTMDLECFNENTPGLISLV